MLIFDFPDPVTGIPGRTVYRDPVRVVQARRLEDVLPAVAEIQGAVGQGLHAAGFIAYEAAPAFERRMAVRTGNRLPLVWFGLFHGPDPAAPTAQGNHAGSEAPGPAIHSVGAPLPEWELELDREHYERAVATVKTAIARGRTYQVNLTARFRGSTRTAEPERAPTAARTSPAPARVDGRVVECADLARLYETLRRAQGAGWHALLDLGREAVVSVSPELFFRTTGRRIETRPMKGTRARGRWWQEDQDRAAELRASEKDRAENLMIVDLLRNDLGRICETGSIKVPSLFQVERYRTVWQLTSTVEGRLREEVGLGQMLQALFPCGSVTGAPKISTMDLIAELETSPREVYCGAIGMIRPDGSMSFNVPIRTLWLDRESGAAEYGAGGGIVWDSTSESEYDELLAKAAVVRESWPEFRLIETMATHQGRIVRQERHLERMRQSADYFGLPFPEAEIRATLAAAASGEPRRLRLLLGGDGSFSLEHKPLGLVGSESPDPASDPASETAADLTSETDPLARPLPVVLAELPVLSSDRFLFHKTTHRDVYDTRAAGRHHVFDVLLRNERDELTEFTRGNLVVELEGRLVTPPLEAGLLPGCFRAELLDRGVVREQVLRPGHLEQATRIWFINSARRWLRVRLVDQHEGRDTWSRK